MLTYNQIGGREVIKRLLSGDTVLVNNVERKAHLVGVLRQAELIPYDMVYAFIKYGLLEEIMSKERDTVGLIRFKCSIKLNIEVISLG